MREHLNEEHYLAKWGEFSLDTYKRLEHEITDLKLGEEVNYPLEKSSKDFVADAQSNADSLESDEHYNVRKELDPSSENFSNSYSYIVEDTNEQSECVNEIGDSIAQSKPTKLKLKIRLKKKKPNFSKELISSTPKPSKEQYWLKNGVSDADSRYDIL